MYQSMKRGLDFLLAVFLCLLLSPLFLVLVLAIKGSSKGPVFFKQKRIGIHKSHFMILKFRTMRSDTPDVSKCCDIIVGGIALLGEEASAH